MGIGFYWFIKSQPFFLSLMFTTTSWKTTLALQKQQELRAAEAKVLFSGKGQGKRRKTVPEEKQRRRVREHMRMFQSIFISRINKTWCSPQWNQYLLNLSIAAPWLRLLLPVSRILFQCLRFQTWSSPILLIAFPEFLLWAQMPKKKKKKLFPSLSTISLRAGDRQIVCVCMFACWLPDRPPATCSTRSGTQNKPGIKALLLMALLLMFLS